jgi:predicted nucleic acid-binding protein
LSAPLVVLDTSVLIAALTTTDEDAESRRVVRAAGTGAIRLALSDELLREAVEVVRRKDRQGQIVSASLAFEAAMDLWSTALCTTPSGSTGLAFPIERTTGF